MGPRLPRGRMQLSACIMRIFWELGVVHASGGRRVDAFVAVQAPGNHNDVGPSGKF